MADHRIEDTTASARRTRAFSCRCCCCSVRIKRFLLTLAHAVSVFAGLAAVVGEDFNLQCLRLRTMQKLLHDDVWLEVRQIWHTEVRPLCCTMRFSLSNNTFC
ncbi:hypothetical protein SEVIR_3G387250v4 [Setaria viridis]|uniref:Uncharacterized protein n=1 Tax=Setaria viridis TaxID=4556 RepID=A0A4U6VI53_SETVI|nr:hypothetical protein SEVIR_3G387250v2 [Setaria viridis]